MYILNYIGSNPPFCIMEKGPRFNPLFIFWVRIFRQLRKVHFIRKIAPMANTKITFYIYYLLISPGIHVYVYYMVFAKLLQENDLKNLF